MNLTLLLEMAADAYAGRPLLGPLDAAYSAVDVSSMSKAGADLLRGHDGTALIHLDVNGPAFPVALFAASRAGIPLVPLNYRLDNERLAELIARHPGAVAITNASYSALFASAGVPAFTTSDWLRRTSVHQQSAGKEDVDTQDTDAPAVVIYTSGTTSAPKGVLLRHENIVSYVLGTVEFASAAATDAALVSVPPYHVAAVANVVTNLYAGRRCIVLQNFGGDEWLELVRAEKVTNALVVPTMLARIIDSGTDLSVPSLRTLAYGGASMPARVIEQALHAWPHVNFVNAYGLTETSSTITVLGPEDHRRALASAEPEIRARLRSAGQAVPTVELEIRDAAGKTLPAGRTGRIWVRGDQVSGEYAGQASALDVHGWFDTRDEGYLDEAGYLFIAGRADDTIIRGGENIAPAQIETVLLARNDISDAAVVGVPDEEWGKRIEAVVVSAVGQRVDPDLIRADLRRQLRSSMTPDRIHVWDALPRTETGKLVRRHVAQLLDTETR